MSVRSWNQPSSRSPKWASLAALAVVFQVLPALAGPAAQGRAASDPSGSTGSSASSEVRAVSPSDLLSKGLFFAYQHGSAPTKGHHCPMQPSCSEYGRLAVAKFGLPRGVVLTADRLHRCGHDLKYYPTVFMSNEPRSFDPIPPKP